MNFEYAIYMEVIMKKIEKDIKKFENIKELLYNSAKVYADNIAFSTKIIDNGSKKYVNHTYADLLSDINAFGSSLYKLGLSGKRVAIVGHNCYEWAVSHFANVLGGIVSVPLDKGLQLGELEDSLIRSEVEAVVFDSKTAELMNTIRESSKTKIKHFICFSDEPDFLSFWDLLNDGKKEVENGFLDFVNYKVDSYSMSILLFTSGTTAKSKAVMLNQYGIVTNIYDMQLVEPFFETDTNIAFLPFHHIFGLTGMLVMLASGVKTVFPDGLRYIKQNLIEYKVSLFVGVPILIEKMYETIIKELEKQKKLGLINFAIRLSNLLLKLHIDVRRKLFKPLIDQLVRYPGADSDALEHISFTAKPGETTAIIGSTGCGKSTLLNLIPRFYDVTGGKVTVDGIDVREMPQAQLHDLLGYVPQKGVLFSGTIDSNLKFGGEDITDAQVHKAAAIAQATDFIEAKPEGYQSPIAQGGSNVSGGQKQRLSIARAIAKNPKVYLFDDSFSALDYKTDVTLRRALKAQTDNATVIIVAQRISTVLHANQILVLDEGRLVGKGTHAQLMVSCPEYQEIARSQLSQKELALDTLNT